MLLRRIDDKKRLSINSGARDCGGRQRMGVLRKSNDCLQQERIPTPGTSTERRHCTPRPAGVKAPLLSSCSRMELSLASRRSTA